MPSTAFDKFEIFLIISFFFESALQRFSRSGSELAGGMLIALCLSRHILDCFPASRSGYGNFISNSARFRNEDSVKTVFTAMECSQLTSNTVGKIDSSYSYDFAEDIDKLLWYGDNELKPTKIYGSCSVEWNLATT